MAHLWPIEARRPIGTADRTRRPSAPNLVARIVHDCLQRELETRRDRGPHAQLGVVVDASAPTIYHAFTRLKTHFDPHAYSQYGAEVMALAEKILATIEAAYLLLASQSSDAVLAPLAPQQRKDETQRTLVTLRRSIAQRKADASQRLSMGRTAEARRMLEGVLRLDPHDEGARAQLRRLDRVGLRGLASLRCIVVAALAWLRLLVRRTLHGGAA
jgi:hypothetical protein